MQSVHPWFKSLRHWTASCQDIAYEPDTTNTANGKYLVSMTGKKTANQWRKQRKNIQQRNINTSAWQRGNPHSVGPLNQQGGWWYFCTRSASTTITEDDKGQKHHHRVGAVRTLCQMRINASRTAPCRQDDGEPDASDTDNGNCKMSIEEKFYGVNFYTIISDKHIFGFARNFWLCIKLDLLRRLYLAENNPVLVTNKDQH